MMQVWSEDQDYFCDGKNISKNCLKMSSVTICQGCGKMLCKNCYTEHQEEVNDD